MADVLTGFDWLSETLDTFELRLAVTFAAIGFLLVVLLSHRQIQGWLDARTRPLYRDLASATVLIGASAFSLVVVLGAWDQTDTVTDIYTENLGFEGEVIGRLAVSFVLIIGTVIVTRFVRRLVDEVLGSAAAVTDHQREITHRVSQVIIWSVALVMVLSYWVDDLGGLLVGAGFFGIVVGMAAQQTLGTILAGFILMFDRPFEIGDWIEVEGEEGIVTDISIVNTRIRSFDGEYVMVPNDVISAGMVTNRSRRGRLRIEIDVGVDYESDLERAADLAKEAVAEIDRSLSAPSPQVVCKSFGDSAVVLGVRFWIDRPTSRRMWRARTAAIGAIKDAFGDEGIKIPFPQRELSGRAETGGFRVTGDSSTLPGGESTTYSESTDEHATAPEDD
ncbi:mechanosensitive ion channel family protein [Natrialbaceae archaeon GCM10025810]|uniref:mechanosensitive ion channel family protein n=1 Tax=Halovalidus salilacus TaxID=3075124 RepID=UPI0036184714